MTALQRTPSTDIAIAYVNGELSILRQFYGSFQVQLDGAERLESQTGIVTRKKAWSDGDSIVVSTAKTVTIPGGAQREVRVTERFRRLADGALSHERTIENGGETRTWRFVYQKR